MKILTWIYIIEIEVRDPLVAAARRQGR